MPRDNLSDDAIRAQIYSGEASHLARTTGKARALVRQAQLEAKPLTPFPLDRNERMMAAELSDLEEPLQKRLAARRGRFTVTEALNVVDAVAESLVAAGEQQQRTMLWAARKLLYSIHAHLLVPTWRAEAGKKKPNGLLYQLKITLLGAKPKIWRRIQVRDCMLDKLHEHIQTVMGWTNSHLHRFEIGGQEYADPDLMEEDFHEMFCRDSTITLLSDIVPKDIKRFRFLYVYDFGDSWKHEVLFEGCPNPEQGKRYPCCLEGERTCPPEDVGGVSGYADFLTTIADRDDEERVETLEWAQGWFDPDEFDATTATKSMWKGLPDWRSNQ